MRQGEAEADCLHSCGREECVLGVLEEGEDEMTWLSFLIGFAAGAVVMLVLAWIAISIIRGIE
jgi:hypothetical protein